MIIFFGMSDLLTISEVSRRSGVAASALRFYEERGLIKSERAGSGHRRYPRPALRRIAFIVFAQRIGLTLKEIGEKYQTNPTIQTVLEQINALDEKLCVRLDKIETRLDKIETQLDRVASVAFETRADLRELKTQLKEPA